MGLECWAEPGSSVDLGVCVLCGLWGPPPMRLPETQPWVFHGSLLTKAILPARRRGCRKEIRTKHCYAHSFGRCLLKSHQAPGCVHSWKHCPHFSPVGREDHQAMLRGIVTSGSHLFNHAGLHNKSPQNLVLKTAI